ncbi:hypothetical protein EDC04DRAFT_1460748 [Pisolithus marmoratus]|nr:hypothetical protein EDC04DRAFT_1460748 [Pisolithus marmoratus]
MWPNSRCSSPFFARPHRQSHSGYAPSLSTLNAAPAHPFPTSAFTFTPPLHLPVQAPPANATPPLRNHGHGGPPDTLLTPHLPDVPLAAAQGLTSILSAMPVNHGLVLNVLIAVYKRAGSPRETDTVLEGMREAAEEWWRMHSRGWVIVGTLAIAWTQMNTTNWSHGIGKRMVM